MNPPDTQSVRKDYLIGWHSFECLFHMPLVSRGDHNTLWLNPYDPNSWAWLGFNDARKEFIGWQTALLEEK